MRRLLQATITAALIAMLGPWTASGWARPIDADQDSTARSSRSTMQRIVMSLPDGTRIVYWIPSSDPQSIRRGGIRISMPFGLSSDAEPKLISPLKPTDKDTTPVQPAGPVAVHANRLRPPPQPQEPATVVTFTRSQGIVGTAMAPPAQILKWDASLQNEMLTMISPDGIAVVSPNRRPIVNNFEGAKSVRAELHNDGVDLHVTLTNDTDAPIELGTITIGGFRLGNIVDFRDFRHDSKIKIWDNKGTNFFPSAYTYPDNLYSPVAVFGNKDVLFGISLLYPMLEYEHAVRFHLVSPGGMYANEGRNWELRVLLMGELPPGESREYTLTVRATTNPDEWLRTLIPYRDFFASTYGPVRYERDPRPIRMITMTQRTAISDDNPYGFASPRRRPDLLGWKPTTDFIRSLAQRGYERFVLWTPTGLYRGHLTQDHPDFNFPFHFMTQMTRVPMMRGSTDELRSLAQQVDLGYWWGRSAQVSDQWDPQSVELLDPDNPEHRRLGFAELDMAVANGAEIIGLDAISKIPAWDAYRWIEQLRERAPGVKFCTEPARCDVLHTLAATFVFAYLDQTSTPKHLADFLLPGHETWAFIDFRFLTKKVKRRLTAEEQQREIKRVADLGYVPLISHSEFIPSGPAYHAAEGWNQSVPADLRTNPPNQTP